MDGEPLNRLDSDESPTSGPTVPMVRGTTFHQGDFVADRFRIVRYIARGGMGEVYEAEDIELHEQVALKTIRPSVADDERSVRRFIREVNLSRRVTHPNVCRIFDVFHHQLQPDSDGPGRRIPLVAMELLPGETLSARLKRSGPLSEAEARPIVAQIVAALTAAHQVGVIHRDFKSSNIILLPSASSPGGVRAVVTDFGLAHHSRDRDMPETDVTATGEVFGTPTYMSPEQVEGAELTPSTDIYSLGIVMYEMVTGTTPFVGDNPLSTAVKRLKEPAASPRVHVPGLNPVWEQVILRCLERHPAQRFATPADILASLDGQTAPSGTVLLAQPVRTRTLLAAALLVVLAVTAGLLATHALRSPGAAPPGAASVTPSRRAVAVLGFRNLSGKSETEWLSTAFSEMLTTELAAGEHLRTISGESVSRARFDLGLDDAETFSPATLTRLRNNLGTDLVVSGSYLATDSGRVRLDLHLQDAVGGDTIASLTDTATEEELIDLIARSGARLRERLGVTGLSSAQTASARAAFPSNPEAARLYAEGLVKLRLFDALSAKDLLDKAVAADPTNAVAHASLAAAWSLLGYDGRAAAQAKTAMDLAGTLSREHRLSVEAQHAEATNEWDAAVKVYGTLATFFPDDVDYALKLASAQLAGGDGNASLATVAALRQLPAAVASDPRIDIAEAEAAGALSDYKHQQTVAARAAARAIEQSARLILARARLLEGEAFEGLGDSTRAVAAYTEARRIYTDAGDRRGAARSVNNVAVALRAQGDLARAKSMYEQALVTYKDIGDERNTASVTLNLGNILRQQGDLRGARSRYGDALTVSRRIGDRRNEAQALHNTALVLRQQGDSSGAKSLYGQALVIRRELGTRSGIASTLNNLANVLYDEEDLDGARRMYEEALAINRDIGDRNGTALALANIAGVLADQGNLAPASKMYDEALAIRRETGNKSGIAAVLNTIANLREDQGDLGTARERGEEALALFRELGETRGVAAAQYRLGRVLTAQGDFGEARKRYEEALAIRTRLEERGTTADVRHALPQLALLEGDPKAAESLARQAASAYSAQKAADDEALALALVSESLLTQGRMSTARDEMSRAVSRGHGSQNRLVRFALAIARARIDGASGRRDEARRALDATIKEAGSMGFRGYELEARLRLGELEVASGDAAAGRARLAALSKEAATSGFASIAQRASTSDVPQPRSPRQ